MFVLLFAGHETTAHTFAAVLGLLSLHPEIQEDTFKQIVEVVGYERDPVRAQCQWVLVLLLTR